MLMWCNNLALVIKVLNPPGVAGVVVQIFNRPGVAGAVLQTPSSHWSIDWFAYSFPPNLQNIITPKP